MGQWHGRRRLRQPREGKNGLRLPAAGCLTPHVLFRVLPTTRHEAAGSLQA